jgi:hypothetical protein
MALRQDHSARPSIPVVRWRATAFGGLQFVGAPIELVCQITQPPAGLVMGQARCKPADMAGAFTETDKIVSGRRLFRHCPAPSSFGLSNMPLRLRRGGQLNQMCLGLARSSAYSVASRSRPATRRLPQQKGRTRPNKQAYQHAEEDLS